MIRSACAAAIICGTCAASPAMAQAKVEVSGNIGYVASEGVTGNAVLAQDGNVYDELNPQSSVGYHFTFGVNVSPHVEVGFLWGRQQSQLEAKGPSNSVTIGDMNVNNYHGYFAYNFGDPEGHVRPFVLGGLGATSYGDVDYTTPGGLSGTINGGSKFSTTLGAGVKLYPGKVVGFRAEMRWTPTYIKSDAAGWWCDPYWGCYLASNAQYSNQFEMSGGVTLRF